MTRDALSSESSGRSRFKRLVLASAVTALFVPLSVLTLEPAPEAEAKSSSKAAKSQKKKANAARAKALAIRQGGPVSATGSRGERIMVNQAANPQSKLSGQWGVYQGPATLDWKYWDSASRAQKQELQWFMDQPKAAWYGSWVPTSEVHKRVKRYIELSQNGDKQRLVQITIFRMDPWYTESRTKKPSKAQQADYKRWIRESARAIGDTPTALFLQPDSTFLKTVPNFKLSSSLIRYAAKEYGKLPNTRVYLETGGWDWPAPGQGGVKEAVRLLEAQGMKYADGVVTNTTHYNKTSWDVQRIADISKAFEKKGIKGIKGVVNTSSNGKGFEFGKYKGPDPDHAWTCVQKKTTCATLGIPPTTDVANPKWKLPAKTNRQALKYVDAYMWVGRPWLYRQTSPFQFGRTQELIRSSPYKGM